LDTGVSSPTYDKLTWSAKLPTNTSLKFQLRSAATSSGLTSATWYGPTGTSDYYEASSSVFSKSVNSVHNGHQFVQYRATFGQGYDFANTAVLDKVSITYR